MATTKEKRHPFIRAAVIVAKTSPTSLNPGIDLNDSQQFTQH